MTKFEWELKDVCIGWIGEEYGWEAYIHHEAETLLSIVQKHIENNVEDMVSKRYLQPHEWGGVPEYREGILDAIKKIKEVLL